MTTCEATDEIARSPGTWFQAYLPGEVEKIEALIDRVDRAGPLRVLPEVWRPSVPASP